MPNFFSGRHLRHARRLIAVLTLAALPLGAASASAAADAAALKRQLEVLRRQMTDAMSAYQAQVSAMQTRIEALERQTRSATQSASAAKAEAQAAQGQAAQAEAAASRAAAPRPSAQSSLPGDFQIGMSGTFAAGGSSASEAQLQNLSPGHHDPKQNGFTVQGAELFLGGSVDPFFNAQATFTFVTQPTGETAVELEEAFFTTRSLPWGLQLKGGQFFTEFGRQNTLHVHQWDFVDQPVISSRLFGEDGMRNPGARISWLAPTPWYSEIFVASQNARGGGAHSFLTDSLIGGTAGLGRSPRRASDLLYTARWLNGFDVSDNLAVNLGLSGTRGPNDSGQRTDTTIFGADLYAKWRPDYTERGYPFVSLHAEAMKRLYRALDTGDPNRRTLGDWGMFSDLVYGFATDWTASLRGEYAAGLNDGIAGPASLDPLRDRRWRTTGALSWYPTHFSKLRLQYARDWTQSLPQKTADTFWLQFEYSLGSHFAHNF